MSNVYADPAPAQFVRRRDGRAAAAEQKFLPNLFRF